MAKIGDHASSGSWGDAYKTERTQAMPKNTLFGSVLEKKTEDDLDDMDKIDVEERQKEELEKRLPRKRQLPSRLRSRLPGPEIIEHSKDQLKKQLERTTNFSKYIQAAQERSLYFNKGSAPELPSASSSSSHQQWITEKDIEGASEINRVGLSKYNNYNRDRFRTKPPVHQYALIGDVLRPGMDFTGRAYRTSSVASDSTIRSSQRAQPVAPPVYQRRPASQSPQTIEVVGRDLPENIKHKFGTKICQQVLQDPEKVLQTVKHQQRLRRADHRTRQHQQIRQMPLVDHPDYRDLGNNLRCNVIPGFTFHHPTLAKETYTQQVFDNRYPDPDEYRCQRDELGTWAEQDVLRDRMRKAWEVYQSERHPQNAS